MTACFASSWAFAQVIVINGLVCPKSDDRIETEIRMFSTAVVALRSYRPALEGRLVDLFQRGPLPTTPSSRHGRGEAKCITIWPM